MTQSSRTETPLQTTAGTHADLTDNFVAALNRIAEEHRPSRSPFFQHLRELPGAVARDSNLLGQIHLVYQSAMHATRAAVYFLPHLDSPAMRKRKLQIFIDDDGLLGGDTHHYQLTRAFQRMGATLLLTDEAFGSPAELCRHLDAETAHFVQLAAALYRASLGPWCIIELMSVGWLHALADALAVHFPDVANDPYFEECFSQGVEERHAEESLNVTLSVLNARPDLYSETVQGAQLMAEALDGVWHRLDSIVRMAAQNAGGEASGRPTGD